MKKFDKNTGCLNLQINDYSFKDISTFSNQKQKTQIKSLVFEGKYNWELLEPLLSDYQICKLENRLFNVNIKTDDRIEYIERKSQKKEINNLSLEENAIEENFTIDFNDCIIMLGHVRFKKHIKKLNQEIVFKIFNDNLLPEFDNIKYWFRKKLKTKKIRVKGPYLSISYRLNEYSATSKEIDQINNEFIAAVKLQRTYEITKTRRPPEIEKALFTTDDLFGLDNINDLEGNVFNQTEKDILELLIKNTDIRNKKELSYLSGKKHSINYRLQFTNHPNFGFIFLVEGENNNHFIWELLNSNATYIWTIERGRNDIELQYKRIEIEINTILACGRENYKRSFRTNHLANDLIFNPIPHQNKDSDFIDAFPKWKHRINELLT